MYGHFFDVVFAFEVDEPTNGNPPKQ